MALADFDQDGLIDVVAAINSGGLLDETAYGGILYGQGGGLIGPIHVLETAYEWETCDVAAGDFDADGDLDIAAVNAAQDSVSVFLNLGDREFAEQQVHAVGDSPRSIVAADFNGDGLADLATANTISDDVSVLLASGGGAFAPATRYQAGAVTDRGYGNLNFAYPGPFLAAGDLDADGDADLAVPAGSEVRILLNDGAGGFVTSDDYPEGLAADAYAVRIGDLDADGDADLGVAIYDEPAQGFTVVTSNGDGTWADPVAYDADFPGSPIFFTSLALGDLDNDGDLDAALGEEFHNRLLVFRNEGDATFAPYEQLDAPRTSWLVAMDDLDADGWTDLALISARSRATLHVWLNDKAGDLHRPLRVPNPYFGGSGWDPEMVRAGDLDADGDEDVLAVQRHRLFPVRNTGGPFPEVAEPIVLPLDTVVDEDAVIADLDADGHNDLLLPDRITTQNAYNPGQIRVMRGLGDMDFQLVQTLGLETIIPRNADVGDFDADGDLDAIVVGAIPTDEFIKDAPRRAIVLENTGDGTFEIAQDLVYAVMPWFSFGHDVTCADLDGDGDLDAAVTATGWRVPGFVGVLVNDGTGRLTVGQQMSTAASPIRVAAADLDADGDTDLAVIQDIDDEPAPYLIVYANDGTGTFTVSDEHTDPNVRASGQPTITDMDGDGVLDLFVAERHKGFIVHTGREDATFDTGVRYSALDFNYSAVAVDFDADGRPDALGVNGSGGVQIESFSFLRNLSGRNCPADANADGQLNVLDFVAFQLLWQAQHPAADCDGDAGFDVNDFVCFQQLFQAGCP